MSEFATQKVLITGASGFIGSSLVDRFLMENNIEVHAAIRKTSSKQYLQDERIRFFLFDLNDVRSSLAQLQKLQFDYVIHCAGVTQGMGASSYMKHNAEASRDFYALLASLDRPPKKFVYLSSLGAYGPADFQEDKILNRKSKPHPVTEYGKSKLQAERWIAQDGRIPYIFIRPTAVYGPRDTEMLTVFKLLSKGIEVHIGFRSQKLSFIHVKDLVEIIYRSTFYDVVDTAYLAASEAHYSFGDFAALVKAFLNKKTIKIKLPTSLIYAAAWITEKYNTLTGNYSVFNRDKVNELKALSWVCDVAPLRKELDFEFQYDLKTGIENTIQWYKKHKKL